MTSTDTITDSPSPEAALPSPQARNVGAIAISDTIAAFHGGNGHFFGRRMGEKGVVSLLKTDTGNEVLGMGHTAEAALAQTMDAMHHLESVSTKANVHMPMAEDQQVLFTGIEKYAPKITPGAPTYPVPEYLSELGLATEVVPSSKDAMTLRNTIEVPNWDKQLVALTAQFINTPVGAELATGLNIKALDALTPEQAVKLSVAFVQAASKYSFKDGVPYGNRADAMTVMDILSEGIVRKDDPEWEGSGVCRNVASSVKAVFDALKQNQTELSMLNNTYVDYTRGLKDDGSYIKNRIDDSHNGVISIEAGAGHAWDTFVTVDESGSANISIIDATWALEKSSGDALKHMDYTTLRMAGIARKLAEQSDDKAGAFSAMADYYNQLVQETSVKYGRTSQATRATKEFVFTEFMQIAASNPKLVSADFLSVVPRDLQATAYQLKDRLTQDEFALLYEMSKAEWVDFDPIVGSYIKGDSIITRYQDQKIERLVVKDPELQEVILLKLGSEKAIAMSEQNGIFRVRLREIHPEWLPRFDPDTNSADNQELRCLAGQAAIHFEENPSSIYAEIKNRLRHITGNQALYDAVTAGRSDYELLKNFPKIKLALHKAKNPHQS